MSATKGDGRHIGVELAERLGLNLIKREGHDLAGQCIFCQSSDAFRLHEDSSVAQCYSCGGKWSPFQVAEKVTGVRGLAIGLLTELGIFQAYEHEANPDPILEIARQKGVTPESLVAFGAQKIDRHRIQLPAYDAKGKQCTDFTMSSKGGKGMNAKGKPAGLFFPQAGGNVRLPQGGETWHLVEGPKDAAALFGLDLLACGLNTCHMNSKFARLFRGVNVVLVPDRDRAGENGSQVTARNLRGHAKSARIAVLPAEFKESGGEDVRDILKRQNGRELLLQAITDAMQPDGWDSSTADAATATPPCASAEITLPNSEQLILQVFAADRESRRLVIGTRGEIEHRDRCNTDSGTSRERFIKKLAEKLGLDRAVLGPLVDSQLTKLASEIDEQRQSAAAPGDEIEQSQATAAANMAVDWDLWHTPARVGFATIPFGEHQETWAVRSQTFKQFVAMKFFEDQGKAMNSDALSAAINLVEAKALFEGDEHMVHVRVAEHEDNIYLDLCNKEWQVVEITPDGWRVINESPVRFRRARAMLPLPIPESGGHIDLLREFLNVDDGTWQLIVAWLVAAFRPRGPYPALALFAEQGSGKSTTGRLLRGLIDPNTAPLRAEPRDAHDLMIAANNSWCIAYDNLSHIPPYLSDALCRLSTGGGFTTRELYTDQDEIIFDSQRPVMLTSIEDVATRSDLLDRCLIVWLAAISDGRRRAEADLLAAFEVVRPKILGALLDAVSIALRRLPSVKLAGLPRMADFALWVTAAETSFGWSPGTFMQSYQGNRDSANDVALEASPVARPLLDLFEESCDWSGTSTELLTAIESKVGEQMKKQKGWPHNGRSLSGHLKRLSPNLRVAGWQVEFSRESKKRLITIQRLNTIASSPSIASPDDDGRPVQSDVDWGNERRDDANDGRDADSGTHYDDQMEDGEL